MMPPHVSIVVLSYDRPALLGEALDSLLAQTYRDFEITVVDNPSPSSAEVARAVAARPRVRLLANRANEGYAGGMNRGIERAAGPYVLLTEDDIVLGRECVERLVAHLDAHPSTAMAAPVLFNRAAGTIRCAGVEIVPGGVFRKRVIGAGEPDAGQFREPFEVNCLDGAVLLARTGLLQSLGGFREDFFMYAESNDLCARIVKAGLRLAVVPGARAAHFEPPAGAAVSPEIEFHKLKNFFAFYLLHAPARVLPEFFCRYVLLGALRAAAGRGARVRPFLRAVLWAAGRAPALLKDRRGGAGKPDAGGRATPAREAVRAAREGRGAAE